MVKPRRGGSSSRTQFHRVYVLLYVKMAAFLLPLQWNCGLIALGGSCVYSVYMLLPTGICRPRKSCWQFKWKSGKRINRLFCVFHVGRFFYFDSTLVLNAAAKALTTAALELDGYCGMMIIIVDTLSELNG